jgi:hypothetical protein
VTQAARVGFRQVELLSGSLRPLHLLDDDLLGLGRRLRL